MIMDDSGADHVSIVEIVVGCHFLLGWCSLLARVTSLLSLLVAFLAFALKAVVSVAEVSALLRGLTVFASFVPPLASEIWPTAIGPVSAILKLSLPVASLPSVASLSTLARLGEFDIQHLIAQFLAIHGLNCLLSLSNRAELHKGKRVLTGVFGYLVIKISDVSQIFKGLLDLIF